jgi:lycopene cyclase domain-containing protein
MGFLGDGHADFRCEGGLGRTGTYRAVTVYYVSNFGYLAVLAFCFIGTLWLEFVFRTRVYRRWFRLLMTLVPVVIVFSLWDVYAIASGHWTFDLTAVTGVFTVGNLPLDELLFFIVIPCCAILTLEAVRSVRGWRVGDEAEPPVEGGVS